MNFVSPLSSWVKPQAMAETLQDIIDAITDLEKGLVSWEPLWA